VTDSTRTEGYSYDSSSPQGPKDLAKRDEWHLSIILSWVVVAHLVFITFVTFFLLLTSPSPEGSQQIQSWATFLGTSSATLAAVQYLPQLLRSYRAKTVGALSIPMMVIQTPGAILMVLSIALRPGTNWTSWITYAVAGIMQGSLLTMCIIWKFRQSRLGIDDFGHPLDVPEVDLPVTGSDETTALIVGSAVESAIEEDVRSGVTPGENTPLLVKAAGVSKAEGGWFAWMKPRA
jgi:uncharacterized protein with PQ loop repeat